MLVFYFCPPCVSMRHSAANFPTLLLAATAHFAQAYNNGMGKTPPMGWNSWCTDSLCNAFGEDPCSEHQVCRLLMPSSSRVIADRTINECSSSVSFVHISHARSRCCR